MNGNLLTSPFFFGAIYLFAINVVFIGISTVVFSKVMAFPIKHIIDDAKKVRINRLITVVILITLVPSIYFGYVLVQNQRIHGKLRQVYP